MTTKHLRKMAGPWALAGILAGLLFAGCRTGDYSEFSPMPGETNRIASNGIRDPRFAVGDMLRVTFAGPTELILPHEETIKDDGTITLPSIGPVKAVGKTAGELQNEIHDLYVPKYYNDLTVTVTPQNFFYHVGGEVRSPGRQVYLGPITVVKAIQSAGGPTEFANKKKVQLTRLGAKKPITVNYTKALQDPSLDLPVNPGDSIHVPRKIF